MVDKVFRKTQFPSVDTFTNITGEPFLWAKPIFIFFFKKNQQKSLCSIQYSAKGHAGIFHIGVRAWLVSFLHCIKCLNSSGLCY